MLAKVATESIRLRTASSWYPIIVFGRSYTRRLRSVVRPTGLFRQVSEVLTRVTTWVLLRY